MSLRARGRRGSGAVPLSLQKNAKGGEQSAQLADAQTSAACPLTHSPASQEEARLPAQRVCARRLTGAVRWRFEEKGTEDRVEKTSAYGRKVIMCGRFFMEFRDFFPVVLPLNTSASPRPHARTDNFLHCRYVFLFPRRSAFRHARSPHGNPSRTRECSPDCG